MTRESINHQSIGAITGAGARGSPRTGGARRQPAGAERRQIALGGQQGVGAGLPEEVEGPQRVVALLAGAAFYSDSHLFLMIPCIRWGNLCGKAGIVRDILLATP